MVPDMLTILACVLVMVNTALGKNMVDTWYSVDGPCECPTSGIHNNLNCSLYCVSQIECDSALPGDPLCYVLAEPEKDCLPGKAIQGYCIATMLPLPVPPPDEWCDRIHNPDNRGGHEYDFEPQFLESSMSAISLIRIGYSSSIQGLEMTFGNITASIGNISPTIGECALENGEYVNTIHMTTGRAFGTILFPMSLMLETTNKVCGPYGGVGTEGDFTYSGKRLLYSKGRRGGIFDQMGFVFAWC